MIDEEEILNSFHLKKENNAIVQFLKTIINFNGHINECEALKDDQKNSLKGVYFSLTSKFNLNDFIQAETASQINDTINTNLNRSNLLNNTSSNAEFRGSNDTPAQKLARILNNKSNQKDFNFLRRKCNKYLRYKNHLTIIKYHLNKRTTPKSLFFSNFPEPMFQHDEIFIEDYNKIILEAQGAILRLNEKFIDNEIVKINDDINNYKSEFSKNTKYSQFDYEEVKKATMTYEEGFLKEVFAQKLFKAERCQVKEFTVDMFKQKHKNNFISSETANNRKNKSVSINDQTQVTEYVVSDSSVSSNDTEDYHKQYKCKQSTPKNYEYKKREMRENSRERREKRLRYDSRDDSRDRKYYYSRNDEKSRDKSRDHRYKDSNERKRFKSPDRQKNNDYSKNKYNKDKYKNNDNKHHENFQERPHYRQYR